MSHITPSKPTPPPPRTPRTNPHPNPPFPLRTTTHVNILPSSPQTLATPSQPPYRLKVMVYNNNHLPNPSTPYTFRNPSVYTLPLAPRQTAKKLYLRFKIFFQRRWMCTLKIG
ncbi:hypothetical protein TWF569_006879 [Orbilia oligospora]|nr:hypothetical protein TWF103_008370 [Orbilia oligospora]KAF3156298.1 hypothetical protein TWF569_006879 [Orbilia oligospora]